MRDEIIMMSSAKRLNVVCIPFADWPVALRNLIAARSADSSWARW